MKLKPRRCAFRTLKIPLLKETPGVPADASEELIYLDIHRPDDIRAEAEWLSRLYLIPKHWLDMEAYNRLTTKLCSAPALQEFDADLAEKYDAIENWS